MEDLLDKVFTTFIAEHGIQENEASLIKEAMIAAWSKCDEESGKKIELLVSKSKEWVRDILGTGFELNETAENYDTYIRDAMNSED